MKLRLRHIILFGAFWLPLIATAQEPEDTTEEMRTVKHIDAIHIKQLVDLVILMPPMNAFNRETIEALNTDDVAGLAAKVPGASVRSYGGLGGLKTVSLRGIGGQHTAVIVDGFQVTNAQTGQMNLGQLQTDGIVSANAGIKHDFYSVLPVSSYFKGSFLSFNTFLNYRNSEGKSMKASARYGSFMRREIYLQGDLKKKGWHVGAFGKYRDANGAYPYSFLNGSTKTSDVRANNDFQDMHFGLKLEKSLSDTKNMRVFYRSSLVDQGLPGAVILYNNSADERMETNDHRIMLDLIHNDYRNRYRVYLNSGLNNMRYFDPTYLSAAGQIDDLYTNYSLNGGYTHYKRFDNFELKWGGEQGIEALRSSRTSFGAPIRLSSFAMAAIKKEIPSFFFEATMGGQYVYDANDNENKHHIQFTPNASALYRLPNENHSLELLYKRNFRLPSFNELYFGQVGNEHLQPEVAHQLNLDWRWKIREDYYRWRWELSTQSYFNRVHNKIVAIPTKNLFVWSMQNVAEAAVYGVSMQTHAVRKLRNDSRLEFLANYTWQKVIDITPNSLTYGHQVAYAPEHTANVDVMYVTRRINVRVSNNYVSGRYALNENVPANYLRPFWTMDVSAGFTQPLNNKHKIGIQFNVRNLTNNSYAFIRSFVMPGRHYLLTLKYEI